MRPLLLASASCLLWAFAAGGLAADPGPNPVLPNEAGWSWQLAPTSAKWTLIASGGFVLRWDDVAPDQRLLTVAYSQATTKDAVRIRPVAFDVAGKRHDLTTQSAGGSDGVMLRAYSLDLERLPREQLAFLGIERLTVEGIRDVLAPAAADKLREAGIAALPYPRPGEPYEFELTAMDGRPIRSRDLRGKVVLLDFWATWCGPCMAKMPTLKEIHARYVQKLEIIGVNCDGSLDTAKRAVERHELPWSNVLAPSDDELRELWLMASGTTGLPRLLLIDRDGILRGEVPPEDLSRTLTELLEPRQQTAAEPPAERPTAPASR